MSNKNRNQQQQYSSTGIAGFKPETTQMLSGEDQQQQDQQDQVADEANVTNDQADTEQVDTNKTVETPVVPAESVQETKMVEAAKSPMQAKTSDSQPQKGFKPVYKVELELTGYADAMDKKNTMIPEQGGKWQYTLFKAIKSCFAAASQEVFNTEFGTILNFFQMNKDGIFNEKFIFRFPENWPGSPNEYTQNRRLVYMIIQTADPKNRKKALEQINMEKVAEGMTEAQKQMLFNYYL